MLNLILGRPGGGKSYEAVAFHILPSLEQGRKIITNLPLNLGEFEKLNPHFPNLIEVLHPVPGNLVRFRHVCDYQSEWKHPVDGSGPLFVIDECHIPLPVKGTDRAVEEWYSMHRHSAADVILITQSHGKINKPIRDLAQLVFMVSKNVAFGSSSTYLQKVYDGVRGPLISNTVRKYKPEYFRLYTSHTKGGRTERFAQDIRPIWHHWSFKAAGAFAAFAIYQFSSADMAVFTPAKAQKTASPELMPPKKPVQAQPASLPPPPHELPRPPLLAPPPANFEPPSRLLHPLEGHTLKISGSLSFGSHYKQYLTLTAPDGSSRQITVGELRAKGYTVVQPDPCFIEAVYDGNKLEGFCQL